MNWLTTPVRLLSLSLKLRPTVSRPVCLGIKHPSGAYNQIFIIVRQLRGLLKWGALSDVRTGLSFIIAPGPRQRSHSRVRVPRDSQPYFTVSDSRLPFRHLLRLAGLRWRYSTPPPHGIVRLLYECSFITPDEPTRDHHRQQFVYWSVSPVVTGMSLPNRCLAMDYSASIRCCVNVVLIPWKPALASRCLAMGYSGFQTSCRNIIHTTTSIAFK
jgi:hypothetical protein